jgi:ParB family chromosome partitioning protein
MGKNKDLMGKALGFMEDEEDPQKDESKSSAAGGYFEERMSQSKDRAKREHHTLLRVDPKRCRLSAFHDRLEEELNPESCEDLISGFKEEGGQKIPAVVRKIQEADYDYEVIIGARRRWVAEYLNMEYLVEVEELNDEEAFRLSDVENRSRKDISDFERGRKYRNALFVQKLYQDQKQMAEVLNCDPAWLSRLINMATLFQDNDILLKAFGSPLEVTVGNFKKLSGAVNKAGDSYVVPKKMTAEAKKIAVEQERLLRDGKTFIKPAVVVKRLLESTVEASRKVTPKQTLRGSNGKRALQYSVNNKGAIQIAIEPLQQSGLSKKELLKLIEEAIDQGTA